MQSFDNQQLNRKGLYSGRQGFWGLISPDSLGSLPLIAPSGLVGRNFFFHSLVRLCIFSSPLSLFLLSVTLPALSCLEKGSPCFKIHWNSALGSLPQLPKRGLTSGITSDLTCCQVTVSWPPVSYLLVYDVLLICEPLMQALEYI